MSFDKLYAQATDSIQRICESLGGDYDASTGSCRAPAPGKGPNNKSMQISFNPSFEDNIFVWVYSEDPNTFTSEILEMKREWARKGLLKTSNAELTEEELQRIKEKAEEKKQEDLRKKINSAKRIWIRNENPFGTVVEKYLIDERRLFLPKSKSLRMARNVPYWYIPEGEDEPDVLFTSDIMLAKIECCETNEGKGIHMTYLDENGQKHPLAGDNARKNKGTTKGACIKIWGADFEHRAVAEGIESALAYSMVNKIPCDSAISHVGIRNYTPPPQCTHLSIAYDNDTEKKNNVGLESAKILQSRMKKMGIATKLHPSPNGNDWNDFVKSSLQHKRS